MFDTVALLDRPPPEWAWDDDPWDEERLQRLLDADPGDDGAPPPEGGPGDEVPPVSELVPSGWTALELDPTDPASLGDRELVEHLVAWERCVAWAQARQARLLAELARRRPADDSPGARRTPGGTVLSEFAADEVALALRLGRGTAAERITVARTLVRTLPETLAAWETGELTQQKVRVLVEGLDGLSVERARAVQDRVFRRAGRQTPAQLRASVRRAVLAVDPDAAADRHRAARARRRVVHDPEPDGMGSIWALLPAEDSVAAYTRLTALARGLGADDPRTMDARRADLLADLLTGRGCAALGPHPCRPLAPGPAEREQQGERHADCCVGAGPKPLVHVTVSITTLLGLDESPADLAGYGPIPADVARRIAADGTWRRLLTDPVSGTVLDHGRSTYTPPAALADHVRARDSTCRFPACSGSARTADLDHVIPWNPDDPDAGGSTGHDNLVALCRHHHRLKTFAPGWRVQQDPDGALAWTTPTGHRHVSRPHDHRPDPDDHGRDAPATRGPAGAGEPAPDAGVLAGGAPPVSGNRATDDRPPF